MFNKILVPLDESALAAGALPHVLTLAQLTGAEVTLMHVIEQAGAPDRVRSIDPVNWRLRQVEAETYLENIKGSLRTALSPESIKTVVLEGDAAERITDFAHEQNIDLIALSSHGRSGLSQWNVSSVVQKIIWRAYTSILLVRAYQQEQSSQDTIRYRRILAPLDGSQRAECVLPIISTLSQKLGTDLLLAHVVARPETPRRIPLAPEQRELIERLVEINREEATKYFDHLNSTLPGNSQTRVLVADNVTTALHNLVEDEGVDLVALCAHGYSGEKRQPYGSVGTSFIIYGTAPLLIIQDLSQEEIEPTQAGVAASQQGHLNGRRTVIYDKPPT